MQKQQTVVFKVGTSTLTHENGKTNIRRLEELVMTLSDLVNAGIRVVLVTSGAIGVGDLVILPESRQRRPLGSAS